MTRAEFADTLGVTVVMGPHKHRALGRVFLGDHPVVIDSRVNYLTILAHLGLRRHSVALRMCLRMPVCTYRSKYE